MGTDKSEIYIRPLFSIRVNPCNPRFLNQWKTRPSIQGAAVSSPPNRTRFSILRKQEALPQPLDPQLAHYLKRRSHDKALKFLEQL
jgi:hypothetical protein